MYLASGAKGRHRRHNAAPVDEPWAFVPESNVRAPKKLQNGQPPGEGVDCRLQPVDRTGQSARKNFFGVKKGRGEEENGEDGV